MSFRLASAATVSISLFCLSISCALVGFGRLHAATIAMAPMSVRSSSNGELAQETTRILIEEQKSKLKKLSYAIDQLSRDHTNAKHALSSELENDTQKQNQHQHDRSGSGVSLQQDIQQLQTRAREGQKHWEELQEALQNWANDDTGARLSVASSWQEGISAQVAKLEGMLDKLEQKILALETRISSSTEAVALEQQGARKDSKPKRMVLKVHLWDDTTNDKPREEILVKEGWFEYKGGSNSNNNTYHNVLSTQHQQLPWFISTDDPSEADLIIWITTMSQHELEQPPVDPIHHSRKVIVLDYADGCTIHHKRHLMRENHTELGYFKRSFVLKDGENVYQHNCTTSEDETVIPYSYSGSRAMMIPFGSAVASKDYQSNLFTNGIGTIYHHRHHRIGTRTIKNNEAATNGITNNVDDNGYVSDERYENFLVPFRERKWTLTNVLRTNGAGQLYNTARTNVVQWTRDFCQAKSHNNVIDNNSNSNISTITSNSNITNHNSTSAATTNIFTNNATQLLGYNHAEDPNFAAYVGLAHKECPGHCFGQNYLRHLRDTKIIVTCNPSSHEGDFRLWESFLSGAMVMVDEMVIPEWMPNPLIHGVHFVTYQANNRTDFLTKLAHFSHPDNLGETEAIAKKGYEHVLTHHMPTNRVEYILNNRYVRSGLI